MAPDDPPVETFGRRIQRLRRDRRVTQRDLASRVGIDFTYLSKLENDRGEPPGDKTVRKLSIELDADVEELLALAGEVPGALRERAQGSLHLRYIPAPAPERHG